jgi:hypothetical protein
VPRARFDYHRLNQADPFEIDEGNLPHLHAHLPTDDRGRLVPLAVDDIYDVYYGVPRFYEADQVGSADWLMLGEVPGGLIICVPLAPANSERYDQCRPTALYKAVTRLKRKYLAQVGWET